MVKNKNMSTYRLLVCFMISMLISVVSVSSQDVLKINISDVSGQVGEKVCVDVTVENFTDIGSFIFNFFIDTSVIKIVDEQDLIITAGGPQLEQFTYVVVYDPDASLVRGLGYSEAQNGQELVTLEDNTILLRMCFELVGEPGDMTFIDMTNDETAPQFGGGNNEIIDFVVNPGKVTINPPDNTVIAPITFCNPHNDNNGSIMVAAAGGMPPYSFDIPELGIASKPLSSEYVGDVISNVSAGTYTVNITDSSSPQLTVSKTITLDNISKAVAELNLVNPNCPLEDSGEIEVIGVTGGEAPLKYSWRNGPDTETLVNSVGVSKIGNLLGGKYFLDITDVNGCVSTQEAVLIAPDPIKGVGLKMDIQCHDSDAIMTGSATGGTVNDPSEYDFLFYEKKNESGFLGREDGSPATRNFFKRDSVWVDIKDNRGCTLKEKIHLVGERPDELVVSIDTSESGGFLCDGYEVYMKVSGGTPGYTYEWSNDPSNTSNTAKGLGASSYTVKVTDEKGCEKLFSFDLPRDGGASSIDNSNAMITPALCHDSAEGSITIINIDQAEWDVAWFTDKERTMKVDSLDNKFAATGLLKGEYFVTFTNKGSDCIENLALVVTAPTPLELEVVSVQDVSCTGNNDGRVFLRGKGGAAPTSFYTYKILNTTIGTMSGPEVSFGSLPAGMIDVEIKDENGCTSVQQVEIKDAAPFSVVIDTDRTMNKTCRNNEVQLAITLSGGTAPYSYSWRKDGQVFSNDAVDIQKNLQAGTYSLTVTDNKGCMATLSEEFVVVEGDIAIKFPDPTFDPISCYGEKTCLRIPSATGGSGSGYRFAVNAGPLLELSECQEVFAGSYTIIVYDSDDCPSKEKEITITEPAQVRVDLLDTIKVKLGEQTDIVVATPNQSIEKVVWTVNENINYMTEDSLSVRFSVFNDTKYTVEVTNSAGCTGKNEIFVDVIKSKRIPIANAFSPNGDGVNDVFDLYLPASVSKVSYFSIFDRNGSLIKDEKDIMPDNRYVSAWDGKMNGRGVDPGVYVWTARFEFVDGTSATRTGTITVIDKAR